MRLMAVASDPMEFSGILMHAQAMQPVAIDLDWARCGRLGEHETLLAANGVGWERASAATERAMAWFNPDAALSTGFCGALDPKLQIGEVVVADCVACSGASHPARPVTTDRPHSSGSLISTDHVVTTAGEKSALWKKSGAVAVEMEAGAIARLCSERRLPFYCIRAVTDLAGETMANDFNLVLRRDGHFDTIGILGNSLRRPLTRIPELMRLRRRCIRASSVLGEFLADCRF
jgi:adenosylhomocysteine nucleosidase